MYGNRCAKQSFVFDYVVHHLEWLPAGKLLHHVVGSGEDPVEAILAYVSHVLLKVRRKSQLFQQSLERFDLHGNVGDFVSQDLREHVRNLILAQFVWTIERISLSRVLDWILEDGGDDSAEVFPRNRGVPRVAKCEGEDLLIPDGTCHIHDPFRK